MIHIGNARAALFSALYAGKNHGVFILRIEDTDAVRSEEKFVESLQDDLNWLGVNWQEGPLVGGDYGPYWQSQRQAIYAKYYDILAEKKLVYPCFCTDQELNLARKIQLSSGQAPRYSGKCLKLSAEQIAERLAAGDKPALRFIVPNGTTITFEDTVKGQQAFQSSDIGDFVVRRADGTSPFLFCNAIDDALMEVSHVLRGEDHLANTPRQILILQALGLHVPKYGHLSLIVGEDGSPLSKRHGSFSVTDIRAQGYLPIAIMNYLARLGHTCDVQALLNFTDLAQHFHLDKLSRSPARFDLSQLNYWQKLAVQALDVAAVWRWLGEDLRVRIPVDCQDLFAETMRANIEFPYEAVEWAHAFFDADLKLDAEAEVIIRDAGETFYAAANQSVAQHGVAIKEVFNDLKDTLGVSGKKLFMPIRVALTGKTHGPELANIAALLGQEKMQERFVAAAKLVVSSK
jgi:glutamyl-tRNA synthetase